MAYRITLADARTTPELRDASSVCTSSDEFVNVVNQAQRKLLRRGTWFNTDWLARLCIDGCCVTWPRWVGTVLGVRACNGNQPIMQNKWWNITGPRSASCGWPWSCGNSFMSDVGTVPCYNEISGTSGKLIRYYVTKNPDVGKTITLFGWGPGLIPLQGRDVNGNWTDGIVLTAAKPFVSSTVPILKITSVVREATQGPSRLYEYDADSDTLRDLAMYDAKETNPRYRRTKITNLLEIPSCRDADGVCHRSIEAMVKLEFVPLVSENDFLMIDNTDALAYGIDAIKLERANNDAGAESKWMKAVRELNFELREKDPGQQTVFNVDVVSGPMIVNPI